MTSQVQASAQAGEDIFSDHSRQALGDKVAELNGPQRARPARRRLPRSGLSAWKPCFERAVRESFEPVLQKYLQTIPLP